MSTLATLHRDQDWISTIISIDNLATCEPIRTRLCSRQTYNISYIQLVFRPDQAIIILYAILYYKQKPIVINCLVKYYLSADNFVFYLFFILFWHWKWKRGKCVYYIGNNNRKINPFRNWIHRRRFRIYENIIKYFREKKCILRLIDS